MTLTAFGREAAKGIDFLWRDLRLETSYRLGFFTQTVGILFSVTANYFLARFVGPRAFADLGVDYFSYILVGVAFFGYLSVSLTSFSTALREAQMTGVFEQLLVTQTAVGTVVWGGSLYHFLLTTLHALAHLAAGAWLFGADFSRANAPAAVVVAMLSILAFSGVGVFSSALIVLFKKGNPLNWLIVSSSWLLGGVLFPVSVLPPWMQAIARWNPLTASLDALRAALLKGATLADLAPQTALLATFAVALLPASLLCFAWAVERSKVSGTLAEF